MLSATEITTKERLEQIEKRLLTIERTIERVQMRIKRICGKVGENEIHFHEPGAEMCKCGMSVSVTE